MTMRRRCADDSARNMQESTPIPTSAAEVFIGPLAGSPPPWTEQPWGDAWTFQCSFCPYAHEDPAVIADHVRGVHGITTPTRPGG